MKLQNIFAKGIVQKDNEERFVDSAELIDAENFLVLTSQGNQKGVGKSVLGNVKRSNYNYSGAKCIGVGTNPSKSKVYGFIKASLYDYIVEYDCDTFLSQVVLQSTTGTRLNFKTGERILNVDIIVDGEGNGDLLLWSGDSNPPRVGNIERMKTWGLDGFTAEEIMLIKAPPTYSPVVTQINTLQDVENYLEDKFISFAYRYRYKDGYYSAFSSWQEYSFTPGKFELDFGTFENKGMLNIFNACNISFNVGPREVDVIDLLYKESNSSTVYRIDKYKKNEEGWADNSIQTIQFDNSKVYDVLPDDQYFRSYDNVPENAIAQTTAGNRVMFANYRENKNLIDEDGNKVIPDYTLSLITNEFVSNNVVVTPQNSVSPFDASVITNGKLQFDFTGTSLTQGAVLYMILNIKGVKVPPDGDDLFENTYNFILDKDYANIQALVADTANGFKTNLEDYFSEYLRNTSLQIPLSTVMPYTFNGFQVSIVSTNVISINLPTVRFEINNSPDPNTFVNEYFSNVVSVGSVEALGSKKSMKSYRSYEIGLIYRDEQVRKTTVLTSANNTIFVPLKNSVTQNIINVNIPATQKPPVWAKTYKFVIKENRSTYEEVYASQFYKDGIYRWVRLDGVNRNKVKEGDLLLVKKDVFSYLSNVVKTKVIEVKDQPSDFITDNKDNEGNLIVEQAGLYMKIRPEGFSIDYGEDEFKYSEDNTAAKNDRPFSYLGGDIFSAPTSTPGTFTDVPIPQGSELTINLHSDYHRDSERNDYNKTFIVNDNYNNFEDYYNAELAGIVFQGTSGGIFNKSIVKGTFSFLVPGVRVFTPSPTGQFYLRIEGTAAGNGTTRRGFLDANLLLRSISGFFVFETLGAETNNDIFYETPDIFNVINGEHQFENHLLTKTFNCYVQGNGAESHQIRDAWNEKYISIDFSPTAISEDEFKQVNRFADITYSGIYNSNTNLNKLNEFNLYLANYKDDIEKKYGPIYKIKGMESNLQVFQEDKDSQVFYGKNILFNADGTTNLSQISDVLGIQDPYLGEYGISVHPDSFDSYAGTVYHSDVKRGVWLKKTNNGLFEISSQGMRSYFKKLFRDNKINHINSKYDQYNDILYTNIQYNDTEYVTWAYSDENDGWLSRLTFNPEDMCRINGKFISFFNGEVYEHNSEQNYNTFYGVETPSSFVFNFSQNPSERKRYKTIEMESTESWELELTTDIDKGYIRKVDFDKEEGVWNAYCRTSNQEIDTSLLACQGIGSCTISGLVLNFSFELDNVVSIGDKIINLNKQVVGTVLGKTNNTITLDAVANIVDGDYVMCSKIQSIENDSLLGYHMMVKATLETNKLTEVFSVNTEAVKSYS